MRDPLENEEDKEDFVEIEGEELEFELRHDKVTAGNYGGVFPGRSTTFLCLKGLTNI